MAGKRVLIVGGGASGMMAAIWARRKGAEVAIFEKNPRVGKKILATGNGRCNYTNIYTDVVNYYGKNPEFVKGALGNFSVSDTIRFFEELGIEHKVEDGGKVFPMSDQASSILDVLLYELNQLGIEIICDANVTNIANKKGIFKITLENGRTYEGDRVIIATGGKAMPSSGSDGNGYPLAQKLGHKVTDIFPALVQIMLEGSFFKQIDGVKLEGTAELIFNNRTIARDKGDILFANYGVSGPPIFQLSRPAGKLLNEGRDAYLKINLLDRFTLDELNSILERRFMTGANKPLDFSLVGLINKRLIPVVLKEAGIQDLKKPAGNVTKNERERIARLINGWMFKIRGTKGWQSAQVTAGGVDTGEIDENTMESKLVKGLFFAGEIMDIDGQCGGFNLQWAWSSGYTAGVNAAL